MENDRSELRWGVEQRLEFIEFRLFWEGHVNGSDVMEQFGLSVNQASSDLNRYLGFAPENMVYDKSARTYVRGPGFKPVFNKLDAGRYLAQLRLVADDILDQEDCWITELPCYDAAPTLRRYHASMPNRQNAARPPNPTPLQRSDASGACWQQGSACATHAQKETSLRSWPVMPTNGTTRAGLKPAIIMPPPPERQCRCSGAVDPAQRR